MGCGRQLRRADLHEPRPGSPGVVHQPVGLPGDPGHLYDAVYELEQDGGPTAIGVRYETSGAFLAMAYQRVSGRLAACFGCPGPGIANLVPGWKLAEVTEGDQVIPAHPES